MFTWKPIYAEIAQKLLEFENQSEQLVKLLKVFADQGLTVVFSTSTACNDDLTLLFATTLYATTSCFEDAGLAEVLFHPL